MREVLKVRVSPGGQQQPYDLTALVAHSHDRHEQRRPAEAVLRVNRHPCRPAGFARRWRAVLGPRSSEGCTRHGQANPGRALGDQCIGGLDVSLQGGVVQRATSSSVQRPSLHLVLLLSGWPHQAECFDNGHADKYTGYTRTHSAQRVVTVAIRPTSHTKTCRQDGCPNQQVRPNALTHSLVLALHAADQPGPSALSTGCAPSHRYVSNTSEEDRDIQGQADGLSCRSARDRAAGRTCDCGNDPASPRRARLRIMRNCRFFGS